MKIKVTTLLSAIFLMSLLNSCQKKCKCDEQPAIVTEGTFCYKDEGRQKEMLTYNQVITMLKDYDGTRKAVLEKALGYEDARINTFDFEQLKKYLAHIENLSTKSEVKIKGISFVYASKPDYDGTNKSYQSLMYIPTTMVDSVEVQFDPVQSAEQGKLVTFKEMLALYGYSWNYNDKDSVSGKRIKSIQVKQGDMDSGAGNFGQSYPPM